MASGYRYFVFLLCIIMNSSFLDAYSLPAFNPPVFSKQPGDITSDENYNTWHTPTRGVFTPSKDNPTQKYRISVIIPCVATITKTYTWYRNGVEFKPEASGSSFEFVNQTLSGGSLRVKSWKSDDAGTYQCAASNDGGQIFSSTYKFESLVENVAFDGLKAPEKQEIVQAMNEDLVIDFFEVTRKLCGQTLESCVRPYKLTVEFAPRDKDGKHNSFQDITKSVGKYTFLDEERGKLYFTSYPENYQPPTPLDGKYECRLTTGGGDPKTKVLYSKVFSFIGSPAISEPSLIYPPAAQGRIITVEEGKTFNFQCVFKGFPSPVISYDSDSEIKVIEQSIGINFFPTRAMHNKKIRCFGRRNRGDSPKVEEFTLNVEYAPSANMTMRVLPFVRGGSDSSAHILCDVPPVNPTPVVTFNFKDKLISDARKRFEQNAEGRYRLSISNPVADDAGVYVCNATNSRGSSFSATRLVILEPTVVSLYYWNEAQTEQNKTLLTTSSATKQMEIHKTNGSVYIKCEISSKDSQNYLITATGATKSDQTPDWLFWSGQEGPQLIASDQNRVINSDGSLVIDLTNIKNSSDPAITPLLGSYTCRFRDAAKGVGSPIDTMFTFIYKDNVESPLDRIGKIVPQTETAGFPLWLIAVLLAVVLLIALVSLIVFLVRRQKTGTYLVDVKERAQGNDPEKELKTMGFQDYVRPDQDPRKGTRASMDSLVHVGSDDEDALDEYAEMDTGKFNEDGSFIGQYSNSRPKNAPRKPSRNPEDGVPTSTLRSTYTSGPAPPVGPEGVPLVHPYEMLPTAESAATVSRGPSTLRSTLVSPSGIQMEGSAL